MSGAKVVVPTVVCGIENGLAVKGVWCKRCMVQQVFGVIAVLVKNMCAVKPVRYKSCFAVKGVWCSRCVV